MIEEINKEIELVTELKTLLNRYSRENNSNTPDFILADYLLTCLRTYEETTEKRDKWMKENQKVVSPIVINIDSKNIEERIRKLLPKIIERSKLNLHRDVDGHLGVKACSDND